MAYRLWILGFGFWILCGSVFASSFESYLGISSDVSSVVEFESKLFYSSKDCLYNIDGARSHKLYDIRGDEYNINRLVVANGRLFICADNALYIYENSRVVKLLDQLLDDTKLRFLDIIFDGSKYLIATNDGVYESSELRYMTRWLQLSKSLVINRLKLCGAGGLYIVGQSILYRYDGDSSINKIYDTGMDSDKILNDVLELSNKLFVATSKGLYYLDSGILKPRDVTLMGTAVSDLLSLDGDLYIATDRGLFVEPNNSKTVKRINGSLALVELNALLISSKRLLVAGKSGLYKQNYKVAIVSDNDAKLSYGPSIQELHKHVMKYNEISPKKIANWRRRLKGRALMPDLSVGYDKTIYGTAGSSTYDGKHYLGPNDWSVTMTWDLANLVYDNDETSIDNRSRLNTQQRVDMLEEVSRIYFERKRMVFKYNKIFSTNEEQFEMLILIEELTASLDAYSGGWFSTQL